MKYFVMTCILFNSCLSALYASCRYGYSDPIYICNYKGNPKIEELENYKGWNVVTFQNITKIVTEKKSKQIVTTSVTEKFNYLTGKKFPTMNFKIERVCPDLRHVKVPDKYVSISTLGSEFCEKYVGPTIVYPHNK
jgi:hypothetical protein